MSVSPIADLWFSHALTMPENTSVNVNVYSQKDQTHLMNQLTELKHRYEMVDPVEASKIDISRGYKGIQLWVVIKKKPATITTGVIKDANGVMQVITMEHDISRNRRILLMIKDGLSQEEINELVGGLTEKEIKDFFSP